MKPQFFQSALLVLASALASSAMAEKADRTKPMNIEADALRHDDQKQLTVFTGRVIVTKGTMMIRGAQLDVRRNAEGDQFGVVTAEPGKLAFFRQKRDTRAGAQDEFMEGEGEVIEYDTKADTVRFLRRAQLRRYLGTALNDEVSGVVIVYDNTTSVLTVDGGPVKSGLDGSGSRVRAVLGPKSEEPRPRNDAPARAPAAGSAASAPGLRSSALLGGDKK